MKTKRREIEEAYGDAIYQAWRAGLNPDNVDWDYVTELIYRGYDRFEVATSEVARLRRQREARAMEAARQRRASDGGSQDAPAGVKAMFSYQELKPDAPVMKPWSKGRLFCDRCLPPVLRAMDLASWNVLVPLLVTLALG